MNVRHTCALVALVALVAFGLTACTGSNPTPDENPAVEGSTSSKGLGDKKDRGEDNDKGGEDRSDPSAKAAATQIWVSLDKTSSACPRVFDYWPSGGLLTTACHLVSVSQESGGNLELGAFEAITRLSPVPVFVSGPHQDALLLGENAVQDDFGRYNPAFVDWFVANAIPATDDAELLAQTKPYYDENLRELADTFEVVYQAAKGNEECFLRERDLYLDAIDSGSASYYYERWYAFLSPSFCGNPEGNNWDDMPQAYDGNVVKSAAAFWIRRSADGTMERWHDGLEKLRSTYGN